MDTLRTVFRFIETILFRPFYCLLVRPDRIFSLKVNGSIFGNQVTVLNEPVGIFVVGSSRATVMFEIIRVSGGGPVLASGSMVENPPGNYTAAYATKPGDDGTYKVTVWLARYCRVSASIPLLLIDTRPRLDPIVTPTNHPSLSVTGSALAGTTIRVLANGAQIGTDQVASNRRFNVNCTALADGTYSVVAESSAGPGHVSSSFPQAIVVDTVPPNIKSLTCTPDSVYSGELMTISLVGDAHATASVSLLMLPGQPGPIVEIPIDTITSNYLATYLIPYGTTGTYHVAGTLKDAAGNLSNAPDASFVILPRAASGPVPIGAAVFFDKYSALAIDSRGNPHIAFVTKSSPSSNQASLKYMRWAGGWSVPLDLGQQVAEAVPCLALDSDDIPNILVLLANNNLMFARLDASQAWQTENVATNITPMLPYACSLVVHNTDCFAIYVNQYDYGNVGPYFQARSSGTWNNPVKIETSGAINVQIGTLTLDSAGNAHVAYGFNQSASLLLKHAVQTAQGFSCEIISSPFQTGWTFGRPTIALSSQGVPNVVILESGPYPNLSHGTKLLCFQKPGGTSPWQSQEIDTSGAGMSAPSFIAFKNPQSGTDTFKVSYWLETTTNISPPGARLALAIRSAGVTQPWGSDPNLVPQLQNDSTLQYDPLRASQFDFGNYSSIAVYPKTGKIMISYLSIREINNPTTNLRLYVE